MFADSLVRRKVLFFEEPVIRVIKAIVDEENI